MTSDPLATSGTSDLPGALDTSDTSKHEDRFIPDPDCLVLIDDREAALHPRIQMKLAQAISRNNIEVRRQKFGDYSFIAPYQPALQISPRIGIELATLSNVLGKIDNDELAYQISGMLGIYNIRILLIQSKGGLQADRNGYVRVWGAPPTHKYEAVKGILTSAAMHGVIVDYSEDENDSARRILNYYNYWQKDVSKHTFFRPTNIKRGVAVPLGEPLDSAIEYLMGVPGKVMLGEQKALNALQMYGSLELIHQLDEDSLRKIPLWGPKTAKEFLAFIRRRVILRSK